ncbi:MAG: NAD(P)H-dependent oxidoreductase subunit E [Deltaproteobacteria bacterium]|nr:NAD(P)H-dependent oxidoreductase subunit E [Deltaproteobacteria bacterium]
MNDPWAPDLAPLAREILAGALVPGAATLPLLWLVQDRRGWISDEALAWVAGSTGRSLAQVEAVVSFYSMFRRAPAGRWVIEVCRTLSCELAGAPRLLAHLEDRLGVRAGETTPDGAFTLLAVECLASCGSGPVLHVNGIPFERVTPERADALLDALREDRLPERPEADLWTWPPAS